MTEIHFLELAACVGDHAARTQLKEIWDAIDPPSDIEVAAFLERHLGSDGPFTENQRLEGRFRLMALMVEQSLGHQLDWDEEDFWGEDEFDLSADWSGDDEEDEIAADTDAGGNAIPFTFAWREAAEGAFARPVTDWRAAGDSFDPLVLGRESHSIRRGKDKSSAAKDILDIYSLVTADGPVMFGNDGVSVYIRRPPGISAARLRLGDSDYTLDPVTGIAGVERVVGLTVSGMHAFIQGHVPDSDSLSWSD